MNPIWKRGAVAVLAAAIAALVGSAFAGAAGALVVVSTVAVAWSALQLRNVARLIEWARGPIDARVPDAGGNWGLVFESLHRRIKVRVEQHQDLSTMLERFRNAVEALPDGMVILDAHDCIVWSNPRAQWHFGIDPARDVGHPLANLVRQPEFVAYLDQGEFSEPVLFHSNRDNATVLSVQIVPYGEDQKLLMSRDVTRLEEVARMRRDFVANVSHELKTPITVLAGFLETLQDLPLDPQQQRRYLGLMQEQAGSMQRLVDDLLTLSALESDENRLREEAVDVEALMREVQADVQGLLVGQHDIRVEARSRAALLGARDELRSALLNLATNAVRYTPAGGSIVMSWEVVGAEGRLAVRDSGIGVAAEHLPRLTERFYRVDRSRSRATGGTGLGLAIVKHVLVRHQAELDIQSEPGRGSTFTARFPPARVRETPGSPATPEPVAAVATPAPLSRAWEW